MKAFFEEYGFVILTCIVVIALVAIAMVLKDPIQVMLKDIVNTWGKNVQNALNFTNGAALTH